MYCVMIQREKAKVVEYLPGAESCTVYRKGCEEWQEVTADLVDSSEVKEVIVLNYEEGSTEVFIYEGEHAYVEPW